MFSMRSLCNLRSEEYQLSLCKIRRAKKTLISFKTKSLWRGVYNAREIDQDKNLREAGRRAIDAVIERRKTKKQNTNP